MSSPIKRVSIFQLLSLAIVLLSLLFAAACGGSKANVRNDNKAAAQPLAIEITTATAITRQLPQFFEATGSLSGDQQTDVSPSIAGKVVLVNVELGSYVKRGQTIVRLDDVDSKLRVEQARAQVDQTKAALRQAEEKVGIRPGQSFDVNKLPEVGNARVALELAEKNLRRSEKLIESGDISRSVYDQQKAQRDFVLLCLAHAGLEIEVGVATHTVALDQARTQLRETFFALRTSQHHADEFADLLRGPQVARQRTCRPLCRLGVDADDRLVLVYFDGAECFQFFFDLRESFRVVDCYRHGNF